MNLEVPIMKKYILSILSIFALVICFSVKTYASQTPLRSYHSAFTYIKSKINDYSNKSIYKPISKTKNKVIMFYYKNGKKNDLKYILTNNKQKFIKISFVNGKNYLKTNPVVFLNKDTLSKKKAFYFLKKSLNNFAFNKCHIYKNGKSKYFINLFNNKKYLGKYSINQYLKNKIQLKIDDSIYELPSNLHEPILEK